MPTIRRCMHLILVISILRTQAGSCVDQFGHLKAAKLTWVELIQLQHRGEFLPFPASDEATYLPERHSVHFTFAAINIRDISLYLTAYP